MSDFSVVLTSGKQFNAKGGQSLLEAATQGGVSLPYSCKTGRCSTCKCRVLSGQTTPLQDETGLTSEEKSQGWVLSCVRAAVSDIELEADDLGGIELPTSRTLPCRINSVEALATDVLKVVLRLPPSTSFSFIPGQYIEVIGPNGVRRSYSLANSNAKDNTLELHIREVPGGLLSDFWFKKAKVNDLLRLNGPLGTFFLRDFAGLDLYLLATGTGIAPICSILQSLAESDQKPSSITVIWGGRRPEDLYLELSNVSTSLKIQYLPVLSRAPEGWSGLRGYVQKALLNLKPNWQNAAVYACGSDAMIRSANQELVSAGLPSKRFYSDAFVCSS